MSASEHEPAPRARAGDRIEVSGLPGKPARRGQITEVLGRGEHERYRVRWEDGHESVFFPGEGAHVVHPDERPPPS